MTELETLMLAVYRATVEADVPFADLKAVFADAALPQGSQAGMVISQRGFIDRQCPIGSIALSASGIDYVESRLLR